MIRSLLVGLDDTPGGRAAQRVACAVARHSGAGLTGLSVLDSQGIFAPTAVPLGAMAFQEHAQRARLQDAEAHRERARQHFLGAVETAGLAATIANGAGDPVEDILAAAAAHDVVVLGRDCAFGGLPPEGVAEVVQRVLRDNPRPVLVTPEGAEGITRIMIAYDGSLAAARVLQMFVLLGLPTMAPLHVASVSRYAGDAEATAAHAIAYLALHGHSATAHPVVSDDHPADALLAAQAELGADLLVMGAYGQRGWRELLLGSATTRLLEGSRVSMLIHH
jgi:nucleotide-binding universal stress UspA family protein